MHEPRVPRGPERVAQRLRLADVEGPEHVEGDVGGVGSGLFDRRRGDPRRRVGLLREGHPVDVREPDPHQDRGFQGLDGGRLDAELRRPLDEPVPVRGVDLGIVRSGAEDAHGPAVAALDHHVGAHDRRPAVQDPEVLEEGVGVQVRGDLLDLQPGGGAFALPGLHLGRVGRIQLERERIVGHDELADVDDCDPELVAGHAVLSDRERPIADMSAAPGQQYARRLLDGLTHSVRGVDVLHRLIDRPHLDSAGPVVLTGPRYPDLRLLCHAGGGRLRYLRQAHVIPGLEPLPPVA